MLAGFREQTGDAETPRGKYQTLGGGGEVYYYHLRERGGKARTGREQGRKRCCLCPCQVQEEKRQGARWSLPPLISSPWLQWLPLLTELCPDPRQIRMFKS